MTQQSTNEIELLEKSLKISRLFYRLSNVSNFKTIKISIFTLKTYIFFKRSILSEIGG